MCPFGLEKLPRRFPPRSFGTGLGHRFTPSLQGSPGKHVCSVFSLCHGRNSPPAKKKESAQTSKPLGNVSYDPKKMYEMEETGTVGPQEGGRGIIFCRNPGCSGNVRAVVERSRMTAPLGTAKALQGLPQMPLGTAPGNCLLPLNCTSSASAEVCRTSEAGILQDCLHTYFAEVMLGLYFFS